MADQDIARRLEALKRNVYESRDRIRRYDLDPRLRWTPASRAAARLAADVPPADPAEALRQRVKDAWEDWLALWGEVAALSAVPTAAGIDAAQRKWFALDHSLDLVQRELIAESSFTAGFRTVAWLAITLVGSALLYLITHGVRGPTPHFEPWPEWGPLKYGEVAFWSFFGVLCTLLSLATQYLARRDFDRWYEPWYLSTALRAPFLSVILMAVVLEFVEWYGEGTWIASYVLEEGNKFYFIAFVSFCLGLTSDRTSSIMRQLAGGVSTFVERAVGRVTKRLGTAVSGPDAGSG